MLTGLLTLLFLGIAGIIAISIVTAVIGAVFSVTVGVAGLLLFKVAPILLVCWMVVKLAERGCGRRRVGSADQRWLDS